MPIDSVSDFQAVFVHLISTPNLILLQSLIDISLYIPVSHFITMFCRQKKFEREVISFDSQIASVHITSYNTLQTPRLSDLVSQILHLFALSYILLHRVLHLNCFADRNTFHCFKAGMNQKLPLLKLQFCRATSTYNTPWTGVLF